MVKSNKQSFLTKKRRRDGGNGDFKRPKQKVGRKLKPANVTDTNFKTAQVRLSDQRSLADKNDGSALTRKNKSLEDLLSHIKHYDPARRKDALWGIKELYEVHGHGNVMLQRSLGILFKTILDRMVDTEKQVREALYNVLEVLLPFVKDSGSTVATTFVRRLVAYSGSAMTSMEKGIRLDAVRYVNLLLDWNRSAIQHDEFVSQLLPSLTAVLSSISIVRASSTLRDQSKSFSVEGNETKKKAKQETLANTRIASVLTTINKLLSPKGGINDADMETKREVDETKHKNMVATTITATITATPPHATTSARSSIVHFLDVNQLLSSSSFSFSACSDPSSKSNSNGPIINMTVQRMKMLQELITTMSTIWCDLYEMMEDKSSSSSSSSSSSIVVQLNSMSIVLNIVQSIHDIITSYQTTKSTNGNDSHSDTSNDHALTATLHMFAMLYTTISNQYPVRGTNQIGRALNIHLTHVLLKLSETVKQTPETSTQNSSNTFELTTKKTEQECYRYICTLLSNVTVLNSMPLITFSKILRVVEFMITYLEKLELNRYQKTTNSSNSSAGKAGKRNQEKQRRGQRKRLKIVMSAVSQWYNTTSGGGSSGSSGKGSSSSYGFNKICLFHGMLIRIIQRNSLWRTHDIYNENRKNIFIVELASWLLMYPKRIWQLSHIASSSNSSNSSALSSELNIVQDMMTILSMSMAKNSHLISETTVNQLSGLFWMSIAAKKKTKNNKKALKQEKKMKKNTQIIWGCFSNGTFHATLQRTTIDMLYHLPVLTTTLMTSLYHVLHSCQLPSALSSRLLSVLHHHHQLHHHQQYRTNEHEAQNEQQQQQQVQQQQHCRFLLDVALGKEEQGADDHDDDDDDDNTEETVKVNTTGCTLRFKKIHLIQTAISFLSTSCMDIASRTMIEQRVVKSLHRMLETKQQQKVVPQQQEQKHSETNFACLLLMKAFRMSVDTPTTLSSVLEYAFELSNNNNGSNEILFQETLYRMKQENIVMSLTLNKLSTVTSSGSTTMGTTMATSRIEHRLNAVHAIVRLLDDQTRELLNKNDENTNQFVNNIKSLKAMQTTYSGLASRIWSQLIVLDNTI